MEDFFEDFLEPIQREMENVHWAPRVESYQKNGNYVIKADLPGVDAKNVHVTVEEGCLTIQGERKVDKEINKKDLRRKEVFYGSFRRSLPIPKGLKVEEIKAKYHNGILEISAPVDKALLPKAVKVEVEKAN
jgi:HSP20 family protein